jgi:predicted ATPase
VPSLDSNASVRLFIERAAQSRPGFAPTPDETAVIAEICRRLDGIPLAIELAAARARIMHPSRIAAALDDRFRLLTGGGRTAVPRQQTLEASVWWSYDLLDNEERTLLRRLSAFVGGFTLEAAEQVCSADPIDAYRVLDLLARLVDKSLVQVRRSDAEEDRYGLLETIRLYAQQRLVEAGEAEATRHRHAAFFVALAERAEPELAG